MRPIKYIVALTDNERARLKNILKDKMTNQTIKKRNQILLDADTNHGETHQRKEIARYNRIAPSTVANVIRLFVNNSLDEALTFKRGEGSNHSYQKIDGEAEAKIIKLACRPAPEGYSHGSLRLLEQECKVILDVSAKKDAIGRMLRKTNLSLTAMTTGPSPKYKTPNS
ncbi:helix-turn-helix domain-containing protein [Sporolactobacillus sp. THM19-2]|uniref:helix-turn-helix domain-containing protein n=1 Tax=Sporolactobacillus sp. THM19-2 TaxID=2511171 RepID=UPI001F10F410|nr:helix-turn-helix domain-containing protein [Sporolactobacillus sp. THM19-2]